jgi:hypothetical protein
MSRRRQARFLTGAFVGLLLLVFLGLITRAALARIVPAAASHELVERSEVFAQLGPSLSIGVFGGMRQVIANLFWLRGYYLWEARDAAGCEAAFALAVAADPEEWFFWTNGARMIAYDFPRWELSQWLASRGQMPDARIERDIRGRAAARALGWLEAAEQFFPQDPRLEIERAMIHLHGLGDRRAAALAFRAAWKKPGAPLFTARIYAELIRAEGDLEQAYDWYCQWLPALPPEEAVRQAGIVLPRIVELEDALQIPAAQRFIWTPSDAKQTYFQLAE